MLTDLQRAELAERGVVRLPGAVAADAVAAAADRVWELLGRRGIARHDRSTWPAGLLSKLQGIRQARPYDRCAGVVARRLADQLLGAGRWTDASEPRALLTFPAPGTWRVPHGSWHLDVPGRGDPDGHEALRLLGLVEDVAPGGGATLVVAGSHAVVRDRVRASARHDAGSSSHLRQRLGRQPWFAQLFSAARGDEAVAGEVAGRRVEVVELCGEAGDVWVMDQWALHAASPNRGTAVRSMWSHTVLAHGNRFYDPAA